MNAALTGNAYFTEDLISEHRTGYPWNIVLWNLSICCRENGKLQMLKSCINRLSGLPRSIRRMWRLFICGQHDSWTVWLGMQKKWSRTSRNIEIHARHSAETRYLKRGWKNFRSLNNRWKGKRYTTFQRIILSEENDMEFFEFKQFIKRRKQQNEAW